MRLSSLHGDAVFIGRPIALLASILAVSALVLPTPAHAEPAACLSPDPAQWPASSRPYFMLAMDTSGSLTTAVPGPTDSCGYLPSDRIAHGRCAVKNTVLAFGGEVNFGISTFAVDQVGCGAGCYATCGYNCFNAEITTNGTCAGCGPRPGGAATRAGAYIRVPMLQDHFWVGPPDPTNTPQIVSWVDNDCTSNVELFAAGNTPLNGMLRDMQRYFQTGWTHPDNPAITYPTPLSPNDRACRSVNVILVTDGDETCDAQSDAVNAATALFGTGVTIGANTFKIKTYVINFAGGSQANTDAIAAAGGTGASYFATNEVQLSQALANIVAGANKPETCDNTDNNCNGCTDEGFTHYCDQGQVCCAWGTAAQRTACLTTYKGTITAALPQGDLTKLPCTTVVQQADPLNWLCFDPKEACDNIDNNCANGVDDGVLKCGSPLHCPQPETCNKLDDDCNGLIDDGNVCSGCVPSPEICDGCDNDCDGFTDNGIAAIPCGQASPPNCAGTITCKPPQAVPKGTCIAGGGFNACSNTPGAETCDGLDNNCNGIVDDGIAPTACVPVGTPPGLVYGGNSQCKMGSKPCGGACSGFIGPSPEICDGIDNDCDGVVDNAASGVGQACGINQLPCKPGVTACVAGALVCQGGVGPQPETCDGVDNNCNGQVDEAPLVNGPPPGMNGCWNQPGNCCTFQGLNWCPPAGATCNDNGALTSPCNKGVLTCAGAAGWTCQGPKGPTAEVCDGLDNNCNGTIDDGVPQVGTTCGSNIGTCKAGVFQCTGGVLSCPGQVGPTSEICDGLDNNCDGTVDNGVPGTGAACGNSTPPCSAGAIACVAGSLVCQGGVGPTSEICDGIDNNCNGQIDEGALADAPQPGQDGCWKDPGNCCTFKNLSWCPPAGATCSGIGALGAPCSKGTLTCAGAAGWSCQNPKDPAPEVCDGVDNNCDGQVDNVPPTACVPAGTPAGLVYGAPSTCKMGIKTCGACVGFVGPGVEICDGLDNNCDGQVDNGVVGLGSVCGVNQGPCKPGVTACVAGAILCQGAIGPKPEVCDGVDNDCDGTPDNAPLADAPMPGQTGCWKDPGNCCSFLNLSWCPPAGATCNGAGTLTAPCTQGALACAGASGWVCQGPKDPAAETCDGIDNNCNGAVDDGSLPGAGGVCGSNVGLCKTGIIKCTVGVLDCVGDVPPTPELCDGLDNDCDGVIDNGIPTGGPCTPPYDMAAFPGPRTSLPCQPGVLQCNGMGGTVCIGGVGPQAELCDGIDNDCDGKVDEAGMSPDGIDGSANPNPSDGGLNGNIGDACGVGQGECAPGKLACDKGQFLCSGGKGPSVEVCDCKDNNCDGNVDNQDPNAPPICSAGKSCVKSAFGCQCAAKCMGELGCPGGQTCEKVDDSQSGMPLPSFYCVSDTCGDCTKKTVKDGNGKVICAPAGTMVANCDVVPVCQCKGQNGCQDPCSGVTCAPGTVCAEVGPNAGNCAKDTCFNNPCQGCGKVCNLGSCIDDPCKANSCKAGEECKPNATFTAFECIKPCADVKCPASETCVDGKCIADCKPACGNGKVCDLSQMPPTCVSDKCNPNPCTADGSFCNPATGACGNDPCAGVLCPMGDSCKNGECLTSGQGGGGQGGGGQGGGSMSSSSSSGSTSSSGAGGGSTTKSDEPAPGIWGLATGGGGCACEASGASDASSSGRWLLVAAACAAAAHRRRRRPAGTGGKVAR